MIVFTSICMNYMPKAMVLGKSLRATNPDIKFYIVLLEKEIPSDLPEETYSYVEKIILAKDLGWKNFNDYIFKHSIVEASTSIKGKALIYMLENVDDEVIYIDPDIKIYNSLKEISKLFKYNSILLTPHLTIPEENKFDIDNNELCALQHGVYNLGFLAVKKDPEGMDFARWWNNRLKLYCYDDIPHGIFTDQRWIDLAPAYFDVKIIKNPGYNVAPWNLSKRELSIKNGKILVNNQYELVFFHFSGFDSGANETMLNYYVKNKDNIVYKLRDNYIQELEDFGQEKFGRYTWSYGMYESGELISQQVRLLYRDNDLSVKIDTNPFLLSNEHLLHILCPKNINITYISKWKRVLKLFIPFRIRRCIKILLGRE